MTPYQKVAELSAGGHTLREIKRLTGLPERLVAHLIKKQMEGSKKHASPRETQGRFRF